MLGRRRRRADQLLRSGPRTRCGRKLISNLASRFFAIQIIDFSPPITTGDLPGALFQSCVAGFAEPCGANLDAFWMIHRTHFKYVRGLMR
jgi:hypothetical protein